MTLPYFYHCQQPSVADFVLVEILLQNLHLQIDVYDLRSDSKVVCFYSKNKELSICIRD
jgi:hypothetical protein